MANRFPQLIAFDLDYTLWDFWVDTHVSPPFKQVKEKSGSIVFNKIKDRYDQTIEFYPDVPLILHRLKMAQVKIAACSRTSAPRLARQCLDLLIMPPSRTEPMEPPKRAIEFFDEMEIYPGSKIQHFKELHKRTGIPYSEMLFFDDEYRNKEVEKLGVTFILVIEGDGMSEQLLEAGLAEWRRRHPISVSETTNEDASLIYQTIMGSNIDIVFEGGTYYMRNFRSGSVIDLHGGDHKTLIGFPHHGLENQQWEFGPLGDGWYIRSVRKGSYFTLEKSLGDGAPVTTNYYPASWVVEPVELEEATNVFRILWPNTNLSLDLEGGSVSPGAKINLGTHVIGQAQQLWQLERVPDKPKPFGFGFGVRSDLDSELDEARGGQEDETNINPHHINEHDGGITTTAVSTTLDGVATVTTTITVKTSVSTTQPKTQDNRL